MLFRSLIRMLCFGGLLLSVRAQVETLSTVWHDPLRNRDIPALLYYPKNGAKLPVVLFSHGLGGTREGYGYLGRHWAMQGFAAVHVQHHGSDEAVFKEGKNIRESLKVAISNPENFVNRPEDISFAIDQLENLNRENSTLKGRLDLAHIGLGGHSFGAYTTLAIAGQVYETPTYGVLQLRDQRITAAVIMSPSAPREGTDPNVAFAEIRIPCFHLTGTEDRMMGGPDEPIRRRVPFDYSRKAPRLLLTLTGGDHMVFSGRGLIMKDRPKDPAFHALIQELTTAFWRASLCGDMKAQQWLSGQEAHARIGTLGVLEVKTP